ncbi:MAG: integrase core domain-containing protein [Fimbriimonas sp.]
MSFVSGSLMDARRRLASRVLVDGLSVSAAAREAGVSRTTAKLWVGRARAGGIDAMPAPSRRPLHSPNGTDEEIVRRVLELKALHPTWGARKLLPLLWPQGEAPVCERTVDRILARAGKADPRPLPPPVVGRFERQAPNELWQMDFKGLGDNPPPYKVLSVLDDASRFLVGLERIEGATGRLVFEALWKVFGEYGMPQAILSDNEHCFHSRQSKGPSFLEARLWRLGVKTFHGRPGHPQTQGKVERFHKTLGETVGSETLRSESRVRTALREFREEYNWVRPHDAIGGVPPGVRYGWAIRRRPEALPEATLPQGAETRKIGAEGRFRRQGVPYHVGRGLAGETIALVEKEGELWGHYAGVDFVRLQDIRTP